MTGQVEFLSKHRIEALTDGIYAVAMTLLVLELKLPESSAPASNADLGAMLVHLAPKAIAWALSFFILTIFWLSHHRAFHYVRNVDTGLLWINVIWLLFASLLPFASALVGEHSQFFTAQAFYAGNMAVLALMALWQLRHLQAHPELCTEDGFPAAVARGARFRCWSLVAVAALAVVIAWFAPYFGTMAFMLMILLARIGRRMEKRTEPTP